MHTAIIEVGNKIDIRIVNQIENAKTTGEPPHIYKSQLLDFFENGDIEISMPSENGQIRLLPLGLRYELVFYTKSGLYRGYGEVFYAAGRASHAAQQIPAQGVLPVKLCHGSGFLYYQ